MRIKTANALWAGTDDEIWINIKGTKGETQKRHLDNPFINDFERGFESMSQFFLSETSFSFSFYFYQPLFSQFCVQEVNMKNEFSATSD